MGKVGEFHAPKNNIRFEHIGPPYDTQKNALCICTAIIHRVWLLSSNLYLFWLYDLSFFMSKKW